MKDLPVAIERDLPLAAGFFLDRLVARGARILLHQPTQHLFPPLDQAPGRARRVFAQRVRRQQRQRNGRIRVTDDGIGQPRGYAVPFAGGVAELPAGVVALARLCGTPVVSFYVLPRGRRRWHVLIDPPVEPPARRSGAAGEEAVLRQLAARWTEVIRAHPEHWAAVYPIRWVGEESVC